MKVSIIIKALNEERRIAIAIESALSAVSEVGGEVILADSASTDRTVEIASRYPIRVVQLAHPDERCCGVGPQLGFQHSAGDFVYILDGDMKMLRGFLPQALEFLKSHPTVAGVSGLLVETNTDSLEYQARTARAAEHLRSGPVDRLDGGGLYRREAIEQVGYLSDRNLHSYEEFDLAARLRSKGWQLQRLAVNVVEHHGHDTPPYQLLVRRWRSRYICGAGEVMRAGLGEGHVGLVMSGIRELKLYAAVVAWWLLLVSIPWSPVDITVKLLAMLAVALAPFVLMAIRKRSLEKATYAVVSWCYNAAGLLRGLLQVRKPARHRIDSKVLHDAVTSDGS